MTRNHLKSNLFSVRRSPELKAAAFGRKRTNTRAAERNTHVCTYVLCVWDATAAHATCTELLLQAEPGLLLQLSGLIRQSGRDGGATHSVLGEELEAGCSN